MMPLQHAIANRVWLYYTQGIVSYRFSVLKALVRLIISLKDAVLNIVSRSRPCPNSNTSHHHMTVTQTYVPALELESSARFPSFQPDRTASLIQWVQVELIGANSLKSFIPCWENFEGIKRRPILKRLGLNFRPWENSQFMTFDNADLFDNKKSDAKSITCQIGQWVRVYVSKCYMSRKCAALRSTHAAWPCRYDNVSPYLKEELAEHVKYSCKMYAHKKSTFLLITLGFLASQVQLGVGAAPQVQLGNTTLVGTALFSDQEFFGGNQSVRTQYLWSFNVSRNSVCWTTARSPQICNSTPENIPRSRDVQCNWVWSSLSPATKCKPSHFPWLSTS